MRRRDDDLFEDSTMTFGQHLAELRVCLFRAIVGLAIGCLIGLLVGDRVVDFIQKPVRDALADYYENQAAKKIQKDLEQLRDAGYDLPGDINEIKKFIARTNLSFEEWYINPEELLRQLKQGKPALPPPPAAESKPFSVVRVFVWHHIADDPRIRLTSLNSQETFMIYLKASLVVGVVLASPWVFYQLWLFVAAGLYRRERRYVHVFLPFSVLLFLSGAALAFFFVFKPVLTFLLSFNSWMGIDPQLRISEWLGFVLMLPLGFGISFQLPLVMLFLERIGVFSIAGYLSSWRIAILSIFIIAMILTPSGDPYSMCLMAGPLVLLYFGGVLLCRFLPRQAREAERGD
jgi:sec-independent protein translocase protein TatC